MKLRPSTARDATDVSAIDSSYAWARLGIALLLSTIGGVGMWSVVVALPAVQAEFGTDRGTASLPYTLTMLGYAAGGAFMGRLSDRFGLVVPLIGGATALSLGYVAAGFTESVWQFAAVHFALIAFLGSSATFGPLLADTSNWFARRRGIAVAICASGNYLAGTIWPPLVQRLIDAFGWRHTHMMIGAFCALAIPPLAMSLRRRAPMATARRGGGMAHGGTGIAGLSAGTLQALLMIAGVACCVAMAMPQVHIVAYCGDLGYGAARGAEMLALMLGFGIVSRLGSGFIADRIGGLPTLMLGSALQGVALLLYTAFDGMASLYVISALFGLFQGGIVPSYAIIVREYFDPREAGARVGLVLMCTLAGMALGGWMSGAIFDLTGSYRAAFINGVAWNLLNGAIAFFLLWQARRTGASFHPFNRPVSEQR